MQSVYKAHTGQDVFDVANTLYGSVSYATLIIKDNPEVDGFEYDFSQTPGGTAILYNPQVAAANREEPETAIITKKKATERWVVQEGQTIFDLAIMLFGTISNVHKIFSNENVNSNYYFSNLAGKVVDIDRENNVIVNLLSVRGIVVNTGIVINEGVDVIDDDLKLLLEFSDSDFSRREFN